MVRGLRLTFLALVSTVLSEPPGNEERHCLVIVGAGVSGFAAATSLLANNFSDFVVLEASDRIGGRIHTVEFGGVPIDKGAEFVHGEKDNTVFELVSPHDFLTSYLALLESEKQFFADVTGHRYNSTFVDSLLSKARDIIYSLAGDVNGSVAEYFYPRLNELLEANRAGPELSEAIRHLSAQMEGASSATNKLEQLGARGEAEYVENEGDQTWKWKSRGYKTLFDILSRKFPNPSEELPVMEKISFGKEVQSVEYEDGSGGVVVSCADGTMYRADHVLMTVSLGVLKKHAQDMFKPPLPQNKTDAIRTLGFGCVGKVFLLFPTKWWPNGINAFVPLFSKKQLEDFKRNSTHGYWTADCTGLYPVINNERMLCSWFSSESCRAMELLTEDQVIEGHLELLNAMVGTQFQIPRPESILRTNWASYPYTLGSYSYASMDSDRLNITRVHLSEPVRRGDKPVVLFAGEATNPQHWSTVHGALDSGRREAANLLQYLKTHP